MTPPPSDDNIPQDPAHTDPPHPTETDSDPYSTDFQTTGSDTREAHAFQSSASTPLFQRDDLRKEPSGFGFIALVAGLICLAALGGIVIYSLLLAPRPPRQPILIEAEGTTKRAPTENQVQPDPNSNVGIFRMLGEEEKQQGATKSLEAKRGIPKSIPKSIQETQTAVAARVAVEANAEQETTQETPQATEQETTQETTQGTEQETPQETMPSQQAKVESKVEDKVDASEQWYVQVAALESQAAANEAWEDLHDDLPDLLYTQNYVAKAVTLGEGKRVWRLLLGPQARQQAASLCRKLKTRARSCLVKKISP